MKKNVNKVEDNTNVLLSYILCILMILIKWTMRIQVSVLLALKRSLYYKVIPDQFCRKAWLNTLHTLSVTTKMSPSLYADDLYKISDQTDDISIYRRIGDKWTPLDPPEHDQLGASP